jgi:MoxR-like ATPase
VDGSLTRAGEVAQSLQSAVCATVRGKDDEVRLALVALLSGGHLLLEDIPGTGKTLLAKSLAAAIGGRYRRVQCTPDLLPADITGTSVYRPGHDEWEFRPGPVFANVVLLDEVNRASPRTQSALLEPMEEHQVTVDGEARSLPDPFFCIATQNPFGQSGTFPLPESQLDRFAISVTLGWPGRDAEREILQGHGGSDALGTIGAVTSPDELAGVIAAVRGAYVAPALLEYVLDLVAATRSHRDVALGASPRSTLGLLHAAQAHAVLYGRDHTTPDDVQAVALGCLGHRVLAAGGTDLTAARRVVATVISSVPVPVR